MEVSWWRGDRIEVPPPGSFGSVMGREDMWLPVSWMPFWRPEKPALQSSTPWSSLCTASFVRPSSERTPCRPELVASKWFRALLRFSLVLRRSCCRFWRSATEARCSRVRSAKLPVAFSTWSVSAPCLDSRPSSLWEALPRSPVVLSRAVCKLFEKAVALPNPSHVSSSCRCAEPRRSWRFSTSPRSLLCFPSKASTALNVVAYPC
mmetsp:Transcript_72526/g.224204  ORF Transcript_72526/g.224204 Transcript_72526/m.224204 type:complete len:206 (+) Transcript_72526:166-783(+)